MESSCARAYTKALGLGALSGLRSAAGTTLFSYSTSRHGEEGLKDTPFAWLAEPRVAAVLGVMAAGELVGDKMPNAPARTYLPALIGRAGAGALVGAAAFSSEDKPPAIGALAGALAAVLATFAGYHLRRKAGELSGIPDPLLGLAEDAIVAATGLALLKQAR